MSRDEFMKIYPEMSASKGLDVYDQWFMRIIYERCLADETYRMTSFENEWATYCARRIVCAC